MSTVNSLDNVITNGTDVLTMEGDVAFSGAHAFTATLAGDANPTFPAGTYTLATTDQTSGVLPLVVVTGTSQTAAINTAYVANNAGVVTITLPATAPAGAEVQVQNLLGGVSVVPAAGQTIEFGTASVSSSQSVTGTNKGNGFIAKCVVANTTWLPYAIEGNLTVA